jgi:hypothetical protein
VGAILPLENTMSEDNEAVPTEETTPEQKNTDPVQLEFDFG